MAVDVSRLKAWRARNIALKFIDGDEREQLGRLHDYKLELLRSNPGSTIVLHLEEQQLTAVAVDANDCIYPVAWAVVQKENKDNWKWFLDLIAADLELNNSHHWTFVSDRHKGLIPAIEEMFSNEEHRFCVRYVHNNLKKNFNTLGLKEGDRFQVVGPGGQFVVDIKDKTCTCRRFDLTGIPCCHAVCAIWYKHDNPENYLDDYYKVSTYLKTYRHLLNPTTSYEFWPRATAPPLLPPAPVQPKQRGRSVPKRRLEEDEIRRR
eukprot:XP_015580917.1 uncharacterized protein LOC107262060 [Ricinus communis]